MVFLQKVLRNGGYSSPEQFFFVVVYMLNNKQFRRRSNIAVDEKVINAPPFDAYNSAYSAPVKEDIRES